VRPGITGLWQVKRTRKEGSDFQEWIQYDMEYVESAGWGVDLWVIGRTIYYLVSKKGALK
jgi:lipopolysaccharide/colanic/teichoic acid biosynthesis glycosyltransferase